MKKFYYSLVIILSACVIFGCIPLGAALMPNAAPEEIPLEVENTVSETEYFSAEEPSETLPENESKESELSETDVTLIPKINVKVTDWDSEKLESIFLAGKTDIEYTEYPSDVSEYAKRYRYEEGETYWLVYEPGDLTFNDLRNTYGQRTMQSSIKLYRFEEYLTEDSIEGLSKEDAIKQCTDILDELGITNYAEPRVYAMSAEKANRYWFDIEDYMDWDWEEWGADEECYYLTFPIEYNGILVNDKTPSTGGIKYDNSYIDFIVSKEKVLNVSGMGIFSPEYESGEEVQVNCSADNAMKIAAKHLDGIDLMSTEFVITDCELVYVPSEKLSDKEISLVPMWRINVSEKYGDDIMGVRDCLLIDVQTGAVVYGRNGTANFPVIARKHIEEE